ncbi:MAG: ABC transporter ATP-binding protein [Hyphomicrobiales bacterium]
MDRIEEFSHEAGSDSHPTGDAAWESKGSLVPVTPDLPVVSNLPAVFASDVAPAIVVENLSKKYGSDFAVEDVSFSVPRGATVGLLGGNGAGKTTTIAMIMGLVIPTSGRACVLGQDMATARHKVLGRMNFESPYVAMPAKLTVRENLNVFGRLYGVRNLKARIAELVEEFDLGDVLDRATGQLSAGQKTRAALAKALLNDPEVLVLDEPTASLDPDRAGWVRGCLQAYQRRRNAAILLSSHNMQEVEELCDFVVIMSYGSIVESGAPQELISRYECEGLDEVFAVIAREEEEYWWAEEEESGSET